MCKFFFLHEFMQFMESTIIYFYWKIGIISQHAVDLKVILYDPLILLISLACFLFLIDFWIFFDLLYFLTTNFILLPFQSNVFTAMHNSFFARKAIFLAAWIVLPLFWLGRELNIEFTCSFDWLMCVECFHF